MSGRAGRLLHAAHPWHGVPPGERAPEVVTVFVELVPTDTVKVELDKEAGLLRLDRPQRYSSLCPEPYGFVPRTLCAERVAGLAARALGAAGLAGDGDPLDVCVFTERPLAHGGLLVSARPIGGLRMFDGAEVDDKIVAVLEADPAYEAWREIDDCPRTLVDRLEHYFLTYKDMPETPARRSELAGTYGAEAARAVIRAAIENYGAAFGERADRG